MELKGVLSGGKMTGTLTGSGKLTAGLTTPQMIYPGIYTGSYSVTPDHEEQVLHTSNLLLTSDIHVAAIPEPEFVQQIYDSGSIKLSATNFATWTPSTTAADIRATANGTAFYGHFDEYEYILKWEFRFNAVTQTGATLKAEIQFYGREDV